MAKRKMSVSKKAEPTPRANVCVAVRDGVSPNFGGANNSTATEFFVFKDGLYYPFIDIRDEAWLKTAALYWDSLTTIVPDGFSSYRETETSRTFSEAGFLSAEIVAPGMGELEEVADDCLAFLDSPEGASLIATASNPRTLHPDHDDWHPEAIHHNKLVERVLRELRHRGMHLESHGRWVRLPGWFARYYMTLLATKLSRATGRSMLTDDVAAEPLANRAVRGDVTRQAPAEIAQGILATLVLQTVHIAADTPAKKLLQFKEKYADELGLLRSALRELVKPVKGKAEVALLQKHLATVYSDQVLPSINNLRGRLRDNRISCGYNNLRASTLLSVSPTALGTALAVCGLGPFALFGGAALSVLLTYGNYRLQQRDLLRSSPYSYVLRAEEQFGKRKK